MARTPTVRTDRRCRRRTGAVAAAALVLALTGLVGCSAGAGPGSVTPAAPTSSPTSGSPAAAPADPPRAFGSSGAAAGGAVPGGPRVIDYDDAPGGFPADPAPTRTTPAAAGIRLTRTVPLYDGVRGTARALLAPDIRGARLTLPIVAREAGWLGVLVPSANRRIGWLPASSVREVPLRDALVVRRRAHTLTWLRDGAERGQWRVALGSADTPTPLGRSYVLGRSSLRGRVYAGLDVFALASVPEDRRALPSGLRGAHIGIHAWHDDRVLGRSLSDGCIRLTRSAQALLLAEVAPGSMVVVLP